MAGTPSCSTAVPNESASVGKGANEKSTPLNTTPVFSSNSLPTLVNVCPCSSSAAVAASLSSPIACGKAAGRRERRRLGDQAPVFDPIQREVIAKIIDGFNPPDTPLRQRLLEEDPDYDLVQETDTFDLEVITDPPAGVHHADEQFTHPADIRVVVQHQELVRPFAGEKPCADVRAIMDLCNRPLDFLAGGRPDIGLAIDNAADCHC